MSIIIEVDTALNAAYIQLSEARVATTVEFNDEINIDLDEFGVAVGLEVLDERAPLPFAELVDRFHVHSDVVELLRLIRPDVNTYLAFSRGNDGASEARPASRLLPA
ncbi:MAG TPA: DUF2283 domain-containing protein [Nocardioides sp.]|uniref:DUF2283 domain-containing protein n=1 Tax=uncultured Nocardioides sp. TaxID=198441 RepID=UPI000EF0F21E|nr:DUF2283 domain-containing protein [uncultured Nocardioides sp.]HCB06111.1 hypothetical protein [Nocardioides sp.]HRD62737.1 DUF2283 domain-containing protein [Nocardioides sp.]HRI95872.1 DUF2283 domain-containing protein [Nocardioides sp.]HRK45735.1 DUF2283 domain-containing protein [Nocardioides sp.]